ncbi:hypothetical protein [Baekduia soli]|nr:hypothetical protein [Baekduia soli]
MTADRRLGRRLLGILVVVGLGEAAPASPGALEQAPQPGGEAGRPSSW